MRRKHTKRLTDAELARQLIKEELLERGVLEALSERLSEDGMLSEAIVESGLMGDWGLARRASLWFGRPFLPLEVCTPREDVVEGLDTAALVRRGLVPLWRNPGSLVVAMPCISSEEALGELSEDAGCPVLPVIGSVRGNRRWLEEHLARGPLPSDDPREESSWSLLFDVGDAQARTAFGPDEQD